MPKVSVYIRPTTGNRTPKKATKRSTGPFYLRYELNGKRIWESLTTRTYTFALAAARTKESSLLLGEATPPKPSPVAPKSLEELRTAFIHDKKTTFKKDGTPLDPDTISSYEKVTREFLDSIEKSNPAQITKQDFEGLDGEAAGARLASHCVQPLHQHRLLLHFAAWTTKSSCHNRSALLRLRRRQKPTRKAR